MLLAGLVVRGRHGIRMRIAGFGQFRRRRLLHQRRQSMGLVGHLLASRHMLEVCGRRQRRRLIMRLEQRRQGVRLVRDALAPGRVGK